MKLDWTEYEDIHATLEIPQFIQEALR